MELHDLLAPLAAAPAQLVELLSLPGSWLSRSRGVGHWSAAQTAAHMAAVEEDGWLPRIEHILSVADRRPLPAVDPNAFMERFPGFEPDLIADVFCTSRQRNLAALAEIGLERADVERAGLHPRFGRVTLGQLLSAWVAHDFNHLVQMHEALAARLRPGVGPWNEFVPVVDRLG
jgi:uncharacterized damage-inducible protein DinB